MNSPVTGAVRRALNDTKLMMLEDEDEVALLQARVAELLRELWEADADKGRAVWREIADLVNLKCRAALIEHRRSVDLGALVDAQEALASYRALLDTVKHVVEERIADRKQSARLVQEIADRVHLLLPGPHTVIEHEADEGEPAE